MKTPTPIPHRVARALRWAALWLTWMQGLLAFVCAEGAPLSRQANVIAQNWLDQVARIIALFIVGHAGRRMPTPAARRGGPPKRRNDRALMRAIIGAALRRAMRHRDPQARAAALADILRTMETHVRALLRRLKHGLTRRAPIPPARGADTQIALAFVASIAADTS